MVLCDDDGLTMIFVLIRMQPSADANSICMRLGH